MITTPENIDRRKIKVLHILTNFSIGGATENTLSSVDGLQKLGYDIKILTGPSNLYEGNLFQKAKECNINIEVLGSLKRKINPFYDFLAFIKIYKKLKKEKYIIIHTHSSKAGIIGRLASKLAGIPIIIHTIHGLPFHDYQNKLIRKFYILAEKWGALFSDKLITVTDTIIQKAMKESIGTKEKYVSIRSGFDIEKYLHPSFNKKEIYKRFGLEENDLIVGKIARFSELKGHKFILDIIPKVVKEIENVKFLFVGSGELEDKFREKIKQDNMQDHVIFSGLIDVDEIPGIICSLDLIVHTSLLEGLARVLPQALAAGKPVISFNIDGAHEVVKNDFTGYLIEPKNSKQLADAIIDILKNKSKARELGQNGRNLVQKEWSIGKMVEKIDKVYISLISKKN